MNIEAAILGACLRYPSESIPWLGQRISPDDLNGADHAGLFRVLLAMHLEHKPVLIHSVAAELKAAKVEGWDAIRLNDYRAAGTTPHSLPSAVSALTDRIAIKTLGRAISGASLAIQDANPDPQAIAKDLLAVIETVCAAKASAKEVPTMKQLVQEVVNRIESRGTTEAGLKTGLTVLDRETGGMRAGSTWVVGGPRKGGKSMFAINLLERLAIEHGKRCLFFGLEMPSVENVERLFSLIGQINGSRIRDGDLSGQDIASLMATAETLAKSPIIFRDDVFDVADLALVTHQAKLAHPDLFAVFVDYAQLVAGSRMRGDTREQEVASVSTTLRRIAMQENLFFVVLSQLNEHGEARESKRLEQDATVIAKIFDDTNENVRRVSLVQRSGGRCTIRLAFHGQFARFGNLAEGESYYTEEEEKPKSKRSWQT